MGRPESYTLLLVVALIAYCQCDQITSKPLAPVELFSGDFPLDDKKTVPIYTRNFNRYRQFGFFTYDSSNLQQGQFTLVNTDANPPSGVSCDVKLNNPEKKKIVWDTLFLDDREKNTNLRLTYAIDPVKGENDWLTLFQNTKGCMNRKTLQYTIGFSKILTLPTLAPGVIVDPNAPVVHLTPRPGSSLDPTVPPVDPTPPPIVDDELVHMKTIDGWKQIVLNSTIGYIMTHNSNGSEPVTYVLFVNVMNGEIKLIGKILNFGPKRTRHDSVDHQKIGSCWKEGNDIVCSQYTVYGKKVLYNTRVVLPETVDWYGALNLEGPAILVVSGKCVKNKCDEYNLRRLVADNKVTLDVKLTGLNMQCATPNDLTVDGFWDGKNKLYCLNFVCLGGKLQYRRICFEKSVIEN